MQQVILVPTLIVMAPPEDIARILGPNEKVELYIKEKIYHPQISIDSLVVTNERIILRHPHAMRMKREYTDYSYSDIEAVTMEKGMLRSTLRVKLRNSNETMDLDKLPTELAEQAYGIIRENVGRFQAPFSTGNANAVIAAPQAAVVQAVEPSPPAIQRAVPPPMVIASNIKSKSGDSILPILFNAVDRF
jgi:hypothetical protein